MKNLDHLHYDIKKQAFICDICGSDKIDEKFVLKGPQPYSIWRKVMKDFEKEHKHDDKEREKSRFFNLWN